MHASIIQPKTSRHTLRILLKTLFLLSSVLAGTSVIAAEAALIEHLETSRSTDDLPAMRKRRQIRALVTYSRTDFAIMPDGKAAGLQVELLNQYEKRLNKGIKREEKKTQVVLIPTTFAATAARSRRGQRRYRRRPADGHAGAPA